MLGFTRFTRKRPLVKKCDSSPDIIGSGVIQVEQQHRLGLDKLRVCVAARWMERQVLDKAGIYMLYKAGVG